LEGFSFFLLFFVIFRLSSPEALRFLFAVLRGCLLGVSLDLLLLLKCGSVNSGGNGLKSRLGCNIIEGSLTVTLEGLHLDPIDVVFATSGQWCNDHIEWNSILFLLIRSVVHNKLDSFGNTVVAGDKRQMMPIINIRLMAVREPRTLD